ncbi:hypothetical protein Poli38472_006576 [Pythium oligandrum]|uniref:Uncharacterized protein n=1 Tax=Pythium oligandrum TaxID=41045 RepID=A0A8K1FBX6_PYTOL|nr:hypothetical protein Poli38472_006576 [Pythium oligandrum]|eukprot:TMW56566.1 hypothetical protein Poli38472_006576 [Pythium oligandrum]
MSGMKAVYRFKGEEVHRFESFPTDAEASNEYESQAAGEERQNHSFQGKMDFGVAIPELKSSGPYAKLVTALKRAKEDSEGFLKDKVEGPVPARVYEQ